MPRRHALTLLAAALLAGCGATEAPLRVGTRLELPAAETGGADVFVPVRDIRARRFARTIRQRYDFSCGSAALATLLTYHYGLPTTEQAVLEDMIATGEVERIRNLGFSLLDMQRYLARRGIRSNGYRMPLDRFATVRVPAIVLINNNGYRHFVVLRGLSDDRVLIADPNLGTRTMPRVRFEDSWNGVLFLILDRPETGKASFDLAEDWGVRPRAPGSLVREALDRNTLGYGMPAPIAIYSNAGSLRDFLPRPFF